MSAPTLGEHKGNGIRCSLHLSAPNGGLAQMLSDPEGQWVAYHHYAALEAELEVFRNPDKFPHRFAEMCFVSGYKQGLKDAAKGVQS